MEIEPKDIDRFVIKVIKTGNCWEWTADKHRAKAKILGIDRNRYKKVRKGLLL